MLSFREVQGVCIYPHNTQSSTAFGAKLIDCGISVMVESESIDKTKYTMKTSHGGTLGTLAYMSPEYARSGKFGEKV